MDPLTNYLCTSCSNPLLETGLILDTVDGLLLCCEVCRYLYFITVVQSETTTSILIKPAGLDPEIEFDLIRYSELRGTLRDYIQSIPQERNINPHFKKNLNSLIDESSTPSDLIRRLRDD